MDLFRKFIKKLEENSLIEPSDRIVIGLSGGVDSVVLLDILSKLAVKQALSLYVAHVNYGLRRRESDSDERFVASLAGKYKVPLYICSGKVYFAKISRASSAATRKNIQNAARDIRYNFFNETAKKTGANKIALAHHADDQAETLLLHLTRGSGLTGLVGMSSIRKWAGLAIIRPLLDFTKDEILTYAKKNCLKYVEDSTNKTNKYHRNFIRNDILPLFSRHNSNVVSHICKTASLLRDEDSALGIIASHAFNQICVLEKRMAVFSRSDFLCLHKAVRRRILRLIYGYLTGGTADLLSDHVEKALQIIDSPNKKGKYSLPKGIKFTRNADKIMLKTHVPL